MDKDRNNHEAELDIDLEPTGDDNQVEPELADTETLTSDKLKDLRAKLKACETSKMEVLEQLQRAKADFLNARKRLEDERLRDRERAIDKHVEELIPLYDSFAMAIGNQAAWTTVDQTWRTGIEGIFAQLQALFASYQVVIDNPLGHSFNPSQHDALKEESVESEAEHHHVINVIQAGFIRKGTEGPVVIRPARVVVGTYEAEHN